MPFCTACGKQNPDDARFCSQCGTRLVAPEDPRRPARDRADRWTPQGDESTATITFGVPRRRPSTSDRQLSPVDAAAVDALPLGPRPAGRPARSGRGQPVPARHRPGQRRPPPGQPRSSSTTSPCRGGTPSSTARARSSPSATSAASTAPTSTATGSTGSSSRTATRSRSASTASSSSPDTRAADRAASRLILAGEDEHRGGPRPAAPGLPRHHHPEDPVPRGQGADQARAHARPATASSPPRTSTGCATSCGCSATTTCRSR